MFVFVSILCLCVATTLPAVATTNDKKHADTDFHFPVVGEANWYTTLHNYKLYRNLSRGFRLNRFFKVICQSYCRSSTLTPSEKLCELQVDGIGVFEK